MNSGSRYTAGAPRPIPDELASSPARECFALDTYFDPNHAKNAVKLLPGEYFVSTRDMVLVTVLGSCVAACIRDKRLAIGGMNHFMLPDDELDQGKSAGGRYGEFAMDMLINHLLKLGARREHLEAKIFGGGNVLPGLVQAKVGRKNAAFEERYLDAANIPIAARDLADVRPRKVYFFPASGRVLVKRIRVLHNDTVLTREIEYRRRIAQAQAGDDATLRSR